MRPPTALLLFRSVKSLKLSCPAAFGSRCQIRSVGDIDIIGPSRGSRRNCAFGEEPDFGYRRNRVERERIIREFVDPGRIEVIVKLPERNGEQSAADDEVVADLIGNIRQVDA